MPDSCGLDEIIIGGKTYRGAEAQKLRKAITDRLMEQGFVDKNGDINAAGQTVQRSVGENYKPKAVAFTPAIPENENVLPAPIGLNLENELVGERSQSGGVERLKKSAEDLLNILKPIVNANSPALSDAEMRDLAQALTEYNSRSGHIDHEAKEGINNQINDILVEAGLEGSATVAQKSVQAAIASTRSFAENDLLAVTADLALPSGSKVMFAFANANAVLSLGAKVLNDPTATIYFDGTMLDRAVVGIYARRIAAKVVFYDAANAVGVIEHQQAIREPFDLIVSMNSSHFGGILMPTQESGLAISDHTAAHNRSHLGMAISSVVSQHRGGQYSVFQHPTRRPKGYKGDVASDRRGIGSSMVTAGINSQYMRRDPGLELPDVQMPAKRANVLSVDEVKEKYGTDRVQFGGYYEADNGDIHKLDINVKGGVVFSPLRAGKDKQDALRKFLRLRTLLHSLEQQRNNRLARHKVIQQTANIAERHYQTFIAEHGSNIDALFSNYSQTLERLGWKTLFEKYGKEDAFAIPEKENTVSASTSALMDYLAFGEVDIERTMERTPYGTPFTEVQEMLITDYTQDIPVQVPRWLYLSIDLQDKMEILRTKIAKEENEDTKRGMEAVLQMLETSVPEMPTDFKLLPGMNWIPNTVVENFLKSVFGDEFRFSRHLTRSGGWEVSFIEYADMTFVGPDFNLKPELALTYLLNAHTPPFSGNVYRQKAWETKIAQFQQLFVDFVNNDPAMKQSLEQSYQQIFTNTGEMEIPADIDFHVQGLGEDIQITPYQLESVIRRLASGRKSYFRAAAVGSGKTPMSFVEYQVMRQLGLVSRGIFFARNINREHIAFSEVPKFFPQWKVLSESITSAKAGQFLTKVALGDYDITIIDQSAIEKGTLPLTPHAEAYSLMQEFEQIRSYELGMHRHRSSEARDKRKKKIKAEIEEIFGRPLLLGGVALDNIGLDYVVVDEAHNFKNVPYYSTNGRVAGLPPQDGSNKARRMLGLLHNLYERDGYSLGMTGTMITNSLGELYSQMRLFAPDLLERMHISGFDAWVNAFAQIIEQSEVSMTQELRNRRRLRNWNNLETLSRLVREFTSAITRNQLETEISLLDETQRKSAALPQVERKTHNLPTSRLQKYMNGLWLVQRVRNIQNGEVPPEVDNPLVISGDAGLLSLDPRAVSSKRMNLVDKDTQEAIANNINEELPNRKAVHVAREVAKVFRQFDEVKGTQLIFLERSVPKRTKLEEMPLEEFDFEMTEEEELLSRLDENSHFSVYSDMRQLLIKEGIPENQIAFAQDYKPKDREKELWSKVRTGEIRIVLASRRLAGEGVNVNNRLTHLYNMDVPWTPALMEQAEGRIIRRGNELVADGTITDVVVNNFVTSESADVMLWQLMRTKADFIARFMEGKVGTAYAGEALARLDDADTVMRMLMGQEDVARLADLAKQIEEANISMSVLRRQRQLALANIQASEQRQNELEVNLPQETVEQLQAADATIALDAAAVKVVQEMKKRAENLVDRKRRTATIGRSAIFSVIAESDGHGGVNIILGQGGTGNETLFDGFSQATQGTILRTLPRSSISLPESASAKLIKERLDNLVESAQNVGVHAQQLRDATAQNAEKATAAQGAITDESVLEKQLDELKTEKAQLEESRPAMVQISDNTDYDSPEHEPTKQDSLPKFSINQTKLKRKQRTSVKRITAVLIEKVGVGAMNSKVVVVNAVTDLPPNLQADRGVRGVSHQGKFYLVAENIERGREWGAAVHEIGAHHTLTKMVGLHRVRELAMRVISLALEGDMSAITALRAIHGRQVPHASDPKMYDDSTFTAYKDGKFTENISDAQKDALRELVAMGGVAEVSKWEGEPPPYAARVQGTDIKEPGLNDHWGPTEYYVLVGRKIAANKLNSPVPLNFTDPVFMEEVLGYLVENGPLDGSERYRSILSRFIDIVRDFVRGLIGGRMTTADIIKVIEASVYEGLGRPRLRGIFGNPSAMRRMFSKQHIRTALGGVASLGISEAPLNVLMQTHGESPFLQLFTRKVREMIGESRSMGNEGAELYQRFVNLDEAKIKVISEILYETQHTGQIDPALLELDANGKIILSTKLIPTWTKATDAELRKQDVVKAWEKIALSYDSLSIHERAMLADMGTFLKKIYRLHQEHAIEQVEKMQGLDSELRAEIINRLQEDLEMGTKRFYFPLTRFGSFWVEYRDNDGARYVEQAETKKQQEEILKEVTEAGLKISGAGKQLKRDIGSWTEQGASRSFVTYVLNQIGQTDLKADQKDMIQQIIYHQWLRSNSGPQAHFVRRRYVKGYATDAPRTFIRYVQDMSSLLAKMKFMPQVRKHAENQASMVKLAERPDDAEQVLKEAQLPTPMVTFLRQMLDDPAMLDSHRKLAERMIEQTDFIASHANEWQDRAISALVTGSYFWTLGFRSSSGLVNLTQQMVTYYPIAAAQFGDNVVLAEMTRAYRELFASVTDGQKRNESGGPFRSQWSGRWAMSAEEKAIFEKSVKDGSLGETIWQSLSSIDDFHSWDITHKAMATTISASTAPLRETERIQREIAFISSVRMLRRKHPDWSADQIQHAADDLVFKTFFSAIRASLGKVSRSSLGRLALHLRYIATQMVTLWWMLGVKATADQGMYGMTRKEAAGAWARMSGMLFIFAGLQGLPLWGLMEMLLWLFSEVFDEPLELALEREATGLFGPEGWLAVRNGPFNYATGYELSDRVKLSLFDSDPWPEGMGPKVARSVQEFFGIPPQVVFSTLTSADRYIEGNDTAWAGALPAFLRDQAKVMRMLESGRAIPNSPTSEEANAADIMRQVLGFSDAQTNFIRDQRKTIDNTWVKLVRPARRRVINKYKNYRRAKLDGVSKQKLQELKIEFQDALIEYNADYGRLQPMRAKDAINAYKRELSSYQKSVDPGLRARNKWLERQRKEFTETE